MAPRTRADGPTHPLAAGFSWFAGAPGNLDEPSVSGLAGATGYSSWERNEDGVFGLETEYATVKTTDDALDRIAALPEPWFLWVAYNSAHVPVHVPPLELHSADWLTSDSAQANKYDAMVEALDTELGRLLAGIDAEILARTHVVFMGDNGTPDFATSPPFDPAFAKGTIHEGGVGVPLIVASPLVRAPGSESAALVHAVDLFASFADLAGVDAHALQRATGEALAVDGQSLLPYLADPGRPGARELLYVEQLRPNGDGPFASDKRAIRDARYKLVRTLYDGEYVDQLFDLAGVPVEGEDLLAAGPLSASAAAAYDRLRPALDALDAGVPYDVPEHPPEVWQVRVEPPAPSAHDTLVCAGEGRDPDGDPVTLAFAWTVDGAPLAPGAASLSPAWFTAGAKVSCAITPSDGDTQGATVTSAPVVIGGT